MWLQHSICVLAVAVALGCSSHDDPASALEAGGATAAGGASGTSGASATGGASGTSGASATGGVSAGGASATGGVSGNGAGGAGGNGAGGVGAGAAGGSAGAAGSAGSGGACQLPLTVGDHSHLDAVENVETYSVSGTTAQELRQSINANRGHEYDALTTWNIAWSYQNCSSPVWSVSLDITYDLPNWDAPSGADAALVASWDRYMAALDCHEYGHGQLALDCANGIYDALAALPTTGDCNALSMAADTTFQGLLDQCKTREVTYDTDTMHGATMGAVFPN